MTSHDILVYLEPKERVCWLQMLFSPPLGKLTVLPQSRSWILSDHFAAGKWEGKREGKNGKESKDMDGRMRERHPCPPPPPEINFWLHPCISLHNRLKHIDEEQVAVPTWRTLNEPWTTPSPDTANRCYGRTCRIFHCLQTGKSGGNYPSVDPHTWSVLPSTSVRRDPGPL